MQSVFKKAHYILLICLVSSMCFSLDELKLNSYFIILLTINSLLYCLLTWNEARKIFSSFLILFALIYIAYLAGLLQSDNLHEARMELQKKLSLFLFPFILYFSPGLSEKESRNVLLSFVISCVVVSLFCLSVAVFIFFKTGDTALFFYHDLSSIAGMHSSYLSMYFCFSIAILIYLQENRKETGIENNNTIFLFSIFILVMTILLLGARTQILILLIGSILFFIYYFNRKIGWVKSIVYGLGLGMVIISLVFLSPDNREHFKQAVNYKGQYGLDKKWGDSQVRYLIWTSALEVVLEHPVSGVGTGDVQDELQKYYLDHQYTTLTYLENTRYNAHNQFLETAIGLGIFGMLVLLTIFLIPLSYAWKHRHILYFIFIVIFMISSLTESMLERQSGIVFYAFFNSFLFLHYLGKTEKNTPVSLS